MQWTQELVEAVLELEGTYYLPYQRYPTRKQCLRGYKNLELFLQKKEEYDPDHLFLNEFYLHLLP